MLTSATAMIFGARAYFFKQHRDALYRAWPGAGGRPWLVRGRGPWLRSGALGPGSLDPRSIPARSPLDPRSARLARFVTERVRPCFILLLLEPLARRGPVKW